MPTISEQDMNAMLNEESRVGVRSSDVIKTLRVIFEAPKTYIFSLSI